MQDAAGKLKELTPLPMNTMLERETKAAAVQRKEERNKKVVEDVPPTTPGKVGDTTFGINHHFPSYII